MNEKLKLELLRFIFDYVKLKKPIDNNFIEGIVDKVVNYLSLNNYVKNLKIYNTPYVANSNNLLASYNYSLKTLSINIQSMLEFQISNMKRFNLSEFDKVLFLYTSVTQVLFHELEHAQQFFCLDNFDESLEATLLKPSLRTSLVASSDELFNALIDDGFTEEQVAIYLLEKQRRYTEAYAFSLEERLAEIRSHLNTLELIGELKLNTYNLGKYHSLMLYLNYLKGYDVVDTPTGYYYSKLGIADEWPKVKISSRPLSFKERVQLGLSISDSEYYSLRDTRDIYKQAVLG